MPIAPTGEQYSITAGSTRAVVTEQGATLRSLEVDGQAVVAGFDESEQVTGGRGQNLLPWPNRIRDGVYSFDGVRQQLPLSEPARHNASHGLVRWMAWNLVEHRPDAVRQSVRILPQPGYPAALESTITHSVDASGLAVEVAVTNVGTVHAPFGYGAHPYLTAGESRVDELTVAVPGGSFLEVDERMLPAALRPVQDTDLDLRGGVRLGSRSLDTAFSELDRGADGRWQVSVQAGDRRTVLWGDSAFGWLQVFTGGPVRDRGLAVEPMTCGPDAFNPGPTAGGMIVLEPGASFSGRWGIARAA